MDLTSRREQQEGGEVAGGSSLSLVFMSAPGVTVTTGRTGGQKRKEQK